MDYTAEQKENILKHYNSIEEYEKIKAEREARQYLKETDYIIIKSYEYKITGKALDKNYNEILEKREQMRNIIRDFND